MAPQTPDHQAPQERRPVRKRPLPSLQGTRHLVVGHRELYCCEGRMDRGFESASLPVSERIAIKIAAEGIFWTKCKIPHCLLSLEFAALMNGPKKQGPDRETRRCVLTTGRSLSYLVGLSSSTYNEEFGGNFDQDSETEMMAKIVAHQGTGMDGSSQTILRGLLSKKKWMPLFVLHSLFGAT